MARNESIATVPVDVKDPDTLKRFLDRLVERLDIVLGYRGGDPYITEEDQVQTISELQQLLSELKESIAGFQPAVDEVNQKLNEEETKIAELGKLSSYQNTTTVDLNSTAWTTGDVYSSFTALGSAILNPPTALIAGSTYKCFVEVRPEYVQRVTIAEVGVIAAVIDKTRAGSTWSELVANAWV